MIDFLELDKSSTKLNLASLEKLEIKSDYKN